MVNIRSNYNREYDNAERFEQVDPISMTIPDQSMSVREIMERYARGIPFEAGRIPIYTGEDSEFPDWDKLDISEQYQLIEENRERILEMQRELHRRARLAKQPPEVKKLTEMSQAEAERGTQEQPAPSAGGTTPDNKKE